MNMFELSEEKALQFHRAIVDLAGRHPNLIERAANQLAKLRQRDPDKSFIWERWAHALSLPLAEMAGSVLADTPDGGLMRANSPLGEILSASERNAIWQRIGLLQFVHHFFHAAAELGLTMSEQAMITGVDSSEIDSWNEALPQQMTVETLARLKHVVALHKALSSVQPDRETSRRWLRGDSQVMGGTPLSLLLGGNAEQLLDSVSGAAQLKLENHNLPRMGH